MSPMVHPTGQLGWHAPIFVATSAPTMQALAAMPTPSVLVVVGGMLPPPMHAVAVLLLPSVSVTMPPIMVPLLAATAAMPAPTIHVDSPITSTLMTAVAQFLAPVIGKGISVPAALMAAAGAMPTPSVVVGVNAPITAPLLHANAALLTPTVGAGVTQAAPLLQSTAAMLAPSVGTSYAMTAPLLAATAAMLTPTVSIVVPKVVFKSANVAAGASSVTIPSHNVGDILIICACIAGSTVALTPPTAGGTVPAWVTIDAPTFSFNTSYFVATATNHTSGTWGSANVVAAAVLSGQKSTPIGGHGYTASTTTAPSITQVNTSGSSALLHFFCAGSFGSTITWGGAPTGYTKQASQGIATSGICVDTKIDTTSDGSVTQTNTNGQPDYCASVEIVSA